jgi:hypothetical protein
MTESTCSCDEFKKALEASEKTGEQYFPAISTEEWETRFTPINFCPWCGKRVPEGARMSPYKDPTIVTRIREGGEPNKHFRALPPSCPNCGQEDVPLKNVWQRVFYATTDSLRVWTCTNCEYNAGVLK